MDQNYTQIQPLNMKHAASPLTQPSTDNSSSLLPPLQRIKPWYFKPKKSKFTLQEKIQSGRKYRSHHWETDENERYVVFLRNYLELMQGDVIEKRKYHLNRMMSKVVRTRSPIQCRSHHQKMLLSFGTIQAIILSFSEQAVVKSDPDLFSEQFAVGPQVLQENITEWFGADDNPELLLKKEESSFEDEDIKIYQNSLWDVFEYSSQKYDFLSDL